MIKLEGKNNGRLALVRRVGESVVIGDDIEIMIVNVDRGQVKLSIKAPRNISVHREEIYKRIQLEKTQGVSNESNQRNDK